MSGFAVEIVTKNNPRRSRCMPVFASKEEARRYGQYLRRQPEYTVISWEPVQLAQPPNAAFPRGTKRFKWGSFSE